MGGCPAQEAAAEAAKAAEAAMPEKPAWEAVAEPEAVLEAMDEEIPEEDADLQDDQDTGIDLEEWEVHENDMEMLMAAFEDLGKP